MIAIEIVPCVATGCDGLMRPAEGQLLVCSWCGCTVVTAVPGGTR